MCVADHGTGFDMHMFVARSALIQVYNEIELGNVHCIRIYACYIMI